jgi:hypothetical protein
MSAEHHDNHGQTPAAWTAVIIMMIAVTVGGVAIMINNWPLFWIGGVGLVVVGGIVGKVMGLMGYGAEKGHVSVDA